MREVLAALAKSSGQDSTTWYKRLKYEVQVCLALHQKSVHQCKQRSSAEAQRQRWISHAGDVVDLMAINITNTIIDTPCSALQLRDAVKSTNMAFCCPCRWDGCTACCGGTPLSIDSFINDLFKMTGNTAWIESNQYATCYQVGKSTAVNSSMME